VIGSYPRRLAGSYLWPYAFTVKRTDSLLGSQSWLVLCRICARQVLVCQAAQRHTGIQACPIVVCFRGAWLFLSTSSGLVSHASVVGVGSIFLSYVELCKDQALDYGDISYFSWPGVEISGIISVCISEEMCAGLCTGVSYIPIEHDSQCFFKTIL
jgi:hypothetical protein